MSAMKNNSGQGWLEFINSEAEEGFASKAVAADNEANSNVIVRELIQNSLDAGGHAYREKTEVVFASDHIARDQIPGLEEYQQAFDAARRVHDEGGAPERAQIERISSSLEQSHIPVLHIFDNGVGLNQRRMHALLADGATDKHGAAAGSAGSYGLGHFTAFSASDMNYILYGGVTIDGERTMSAHAILASHEMDEQDKGKDGYYIKGRNTKRKKGESRYHFPLNKQIKPYVQRNLDHIRSNYKNGSVVSIIAFNHFRGETTDKDMPELITKVAARHFFPAIHQGRLEIKVKCNGEDHLLDQITVHGILQDMQQDKPSSQKDNFISPAKAYAAYRTLLEGEHRTIDTRLGNVDLYFRPADSDERTHISLFRSGMYICDKLPKNNPTTYKSYKPFNAVILADEPNDAPGSNKAFQLIRGAEGEKHVTIIKERLQEGEPEEFDQLFKDIQKSIRNTAIKDEGDSFFPDSFMLLEAPSEEVSPARRSRKRPDNMPAELRLPYTPVSEYINDISDPGGVKDPIEPSPEPVHPPGPNPNPVNPAPSFQRSGKRTQAKVGARRRQRRLDLLLQPQTDIENAGLRLILDRGSDPSCTAPLPNRFIALKSNAVMGDRQVSGDAYQKDSHGKVYEVILGSLRKGQRCKIIINLAEDIPDNVILKVDLVSRGNNEGRS